MRGVYKYGWYMDVLIVVKYIFVIKFICEEFVGMIYFWLFFWIVIVVMW